MYVLSFCGILQHTLYLLSTHSVLPAPIRTGVPSSDGADLKIMYIVVRYIQGIAFLHCIYTQSSAGQPPLRSSMHDGIHANK